MTYELSLSSLEYPDEITYEQDFNNHDLRDFYLNKFSRTLTYELFKSNVAYVTVYYPTLQYTHISESPKTEIIDLLTQIGGALGMFVSFSVFTIFEFIEIFFLIFKNLIGKPEIRISNQSP